MTYQLVTSTTRRGKDVTEQYTVAEDLLPQVNQLTDIEAARLAQIIVARLAKMEAVIGQQSPTEGLLLQIQLLDIDQLAETLRMIADRMVKAK